jgi:hypothetical protein
MRCFTSSTPWGVPTVTKAYCSVQSRRVPAFVSVRSTVTTDTQRRMPATIAS